MKKIGNSTRIHLIVTKISIRIMDPVLFHKKKRTAIRFIFDIKKLFIQSICLSGHFSLPIFLIFHKIIH